MVRGTPTLLLLLHLLLLFLILLLPPIPPASAVSLGINIILCEAIFAAKGDNVAKGSLGTQEHIQMIKCVSEGAAERRTFIKENVITGTRSEEKKNCFRIFLAPVFSLFINILL